MTPWQQACGCWGAQGGCGYPGENGCMLGKKTTVSTSSHWKKMGCGVLTQQESWPFQVYHFSVFVSFALRFSPTSPVSELTFCVATKLVSRSSCGIFCSSSVSLQRSEQAYVNVSYLSLFSACLKTPRLLVNESRGYEFFNQRIQQRSFESYSRKGYSRLKRCRTLTDF